MSDPAEPGGIRVFLLDDHEVVRRGVRELLEAESRHHGGRRGGHRRVGAWRRIPALRPDVAILDVRLPDGDGVSVCRDIRSRVPEVACLMLTSFGDDEALFDAIMAGAAGYVLKQIRGIDLVGAVRTVASGPACSTRRPRAGSCAGCAIRPPAPTRWRGLTAQERQILGSHRRGPDEPPDRRADVPGGEDRQELRLGPVRQARHGAPHPGSCLCRPPPRRGRPWPLA